MTAASLSESTSSVAQQTHTVQVGLADHRFEPDIIQAETGDVHLTKFSNHSFLLKSPQIVEFQFYPANHSVVRADYGLPCVPFEMTGTNRIGFSSGFLPVDKFLENARPRTRPLPAID
jgi:hypothetical protein